MESNECSCNNHVYNVWNNSDVYIILTGGNRGIGFALAKSLIQDFTDPKKNIDSINFLFIVREKESITKQRCVFESMKNTSFNGRLNIIIEDECCFDLGDLTEDKISKAYQCLKRYEPENFDKKSFYILFHNAATIGNIQLPNFGYIPLEEQTAYTKVNLISMTALTGKFFELFLKKSEAERKLQNFIVVNMTSLCGQVPFSHMFMYCSIKAAREMYIKCLSTDMPEICAINYSPGPVQTHMWETFSTKRGNPDKKQTNDSKIIVNQPDLPVNILLKLIDKLYFKDGSCEHNFNICPVHEKKKINFSKGEYFSVEFVSE